MSLLSRDCGPSWSDLPPELLLMIGTCLEASEVPRMALTNRDTFDVVNREISTRSLTGIRLSYLNQRQQVTAAAGADQQDNDQQPLERDRFGRLLELAFTPSDLKAFLQEELLPPQRIVLKHMFEWNRRHSVSLDCQFIVAGGSMLAFYLQYVHQYHRIDKKDEEEGEDEKNPPCKRRRHWNAEFGDLDVFVLEPPSGSPKDTDQVVEQVLRSASKEIAQSAARDDCKDEEHYRRWDHHVFRNSGTLTLVGGNPRRPLQIVLWRFSCVEELLVFFDLDCCRFACDGRPRLWTTVEGQRAVTLHRNFVDNKHRGNPMYARRAVKYGYRGFDTDFGKIHPLQHLLSPNQAVIARQQWKTESRHSEALQSDRASYVEEYTSFGNIKLEELPDLANYDGDEDGEEAEATEMDSYENQDNYGELKLRFGAKNSELKALLERSDYALTLDEHFDIFPVSSAPLFHHYCYESHLRRKYSFVRCYITGKWFHGPPQFVCLDRDTPT